MRNKYLGIDIGSVAVSMVVLNEQMKAVYTYYAFHKGQIAEQLEKGLKEINPDEIRATGYTSSTPPVLKYGLQTDSRVAYIRAARHFHPSLDGLLIIGAEKFGLVTFNENGDYKNYKSNTSCAAGTGNFLDQQVERLNLSSIIHFSRLAYENKGSIPLIASRCAVFAKTDLIHAQQEGYCLAEICDGLSYGLARNIVDAVLPEHTFSSLVAAGGVALNKAVIRHIESLAGVRIIVDELSHLYGALGAALCCADENYQEEYPSNSIADILSSDKKNKNLYYPPLRLLYSEYPDFSDHKQYEFQSRLFPEMKPVEIDLYREPGTDTEVYLGIDIGSTSTKAVLMDMNKTVFAGLYTRTAGRPLQAVQSLFEAVLGMEETHQIRFIIRGTATTGSGRKFMGKIIGADIILDEITAHARAAYELDPETDTIIEIGGQDSKFTVMRHGMVTFSVMNNVCAAGTGSFIEEQAKKLNCPLSEYSDRASRAGAPLSSDRCTVFMERDLNHYLNNGYSVDEILASVLHSTRENYLSKVAVSGSIGKKIFFQGATAKNKALVAAFEMKLKKPIMVSKFCHLTGALGAALELYDKTISRTSFRGLGICRKNIPVVSETCGICTNHCKLKVARIDGEIEAYGFLCGRDYATQKFVRNQHSGFQLIKKRNGIFSFRPQVARTDMVIGIPDGLHLHDEMIFWQKFFDLLDIRTISSEDHTRAVKEGKTICSAEFCSPVAAMHGHVNFLMDKADYIFLPVYLEEDSKIKGNKQYCYYTQFVSSVISVRKNFERSEKILHPVLRTRRGGMHAMNELHNMLKGIGLREISMARVTQAYADANKFIWQLRKKWRKIYTEETNDFRDIFVMLLGRPYTVLSPLMNNNIPELIEKNGVKAFFMDMIPGGQPLSPDTIGLLKKIRWKYAAKIIHTADIVAQTANCYPILVTSFKCTPDSFVIEYFKEIFDAYKKPYLVLQLDEHDSAVGYETRIEAGIRAFRNHQRNTLATVNASQVTQHPFLEVKNDTSEKQGLSSYFGTLTREAGRILNMHPEDIKNLRKTLKSFKTPKDDTGGQYINRASALKNKTLLLPAWDQLAGLLLEAVLKNAGINARLLTSTQESMVKSLSQNTGQCIPLNIIVQNAIDYINENRLDPEKTVIWSVNSDLPCNLSMFPYFTEKLLKGHGKGMEQVSVYLGDIIFYDFSLKTAINAYLAYLFSGYVRKMGCMIRPYEKEKGATDQVLTWAMNLLYKVLLEDSPREPAVEQIVRTFETIPTEKRKRAKVAIFGDLYVRDNEMMNQNLITTIEENGGEVVTTSYSDYIKIVIDPIMDRLYKEGNYLKYARNAFLKSLIPLVENKFTKYFYRIVPPLIPIKNEETAEWFREFGLTPFHRGESLENILKIHCLVRNHPDLDLFVQTNPAYCCPSLVTEAMTSKIEKLTGIPVVTIEYDGTTAQKNDVIIPYLKLRSTRKKC